MLKFKVILDQSEMIYRPIVASLRVSPKAAVSAPGWTLRKKRRDG